MKSTGITATSVVVLGAIVLAALAARFWPVRQEKEPVAAPSLAVAVAPRGADSREFAPPATDQGVRSGIVAATDVETSVEPVSTVADDASTEAWREAFMRLSGPERHALDQADRTPRPYVMGCLTLPPTAFVCPGKSPLIVEEVDPDWSHATEQRLQDIWRENVNVKGFSSDFLFVVCKTTMCQVNYRFLPETDEAVRRKLIGEFIQGFRASDLRSELRITRGIYAGLVWAEEFERKSPKAGSRSLQ